jgi:hypothetical protein
MLRNRGEQHATAMEANLTRLEGKLDALLAQFERDGQAGLQETSSVARQDKQDADMPKKDEKQDQ